MKIKARSSVLAGILIACFFAAIAHGGEPVPPKPGTFLKEKVTPDTNRRATVDAAKFIELSKPDCGIQEAIDALPPQGGEVVLPEGTFTLRKSLVLRNGVRLRGQGAKTQLAQPSPLVQTKLTRLNSEGDTTLKVQDSTGFTPGMEISAGFRGKMLPFFSKRFPEDPAMTIARVFVVSVKDKTIQISAPLGERMEMEDGGCIVANFFPVIYATHASDIEVRDLEIVGGDDDPAADIGQFRIHGDYSASALTFFYVDRARISNVTIRGWKGDGFSLQGGNNNLISECKAFNMKGSEAKGFHPGSVQNECIITRSLADGCEGPGIFFCREVKFSVIGNSISNNNGEMIGGFSDFYDHFNICNRNFGENNKKGIRFGEGRDHVFVGNTLVNTAEFPIQFIGDAGMDKDEAPNWWPQNQVVAGNTIVNQGETSNVEPLILIRPKTAASVIANNVFQSGNNALAIKDDAPDLNVVADNHPLKGAYAKPVVPKIPPALPAITVDAATFYDPDKSDCGFQAAINKAGKAGGRVQLPAGIYALSQSLSLPSGVTLSGAGTVTVLLWKGTGPAIASKDQSQIAIRQLSIRQSPDNSQPTQAIAITGGTGVLIDSVIVDDMTGTGIQLKGTKDTLISQTLVSGCETGYVCEDIRGLTIAESWSLRNTGDGIRIVNGSEGIVIDSSIISGNRGYGIAALKISNGAFSLLSSVITESVKNGLFLQDCDGGTVRGSIVHRGRISEFEKFPPAAAILLAGTTKNMRITENRVSEVNKFPRPKIAVEEEATASGNTIRFNVLCSDNYTGDVLALSGKDTVAKDNILTPSPFKYPPDVATAQ